MIIDFHTHAFPEKIAKMAMEKLSFASGGLIPQTDGSVITISEAIGKERFSKVYLMFGINELGWGSIASFINYYGQIVDRIRQVNPEAIIYVQSIELQ